MNNHPAFSLQRLWLLVRRSIRLDLTLWMTGFAAVAGMYFLLSLAVKALVNEEAVAYYGVTGMGLFIYTLGGYLMTSRMFQELHDPAGGYVLLTLPASPLEKFLSAWLISAPMYTLAALITLMVAETGASGLASRLFDSQFHLFAPFEEHVRQQVVTYFGIQSVFLLGAVVFRKNNFLKTVLAVVVINVVLGLFFGAIMMAIMVVQPDFPAMLFGTEHMDIAIRYGSVASTLSLFLLMLGCLTIGYYRFVHRQL